MLKLIALVVGLAAGFVLGNIWSVRNPAQASALVVQEEREFLKAQMEISQAVKAKLDHLANRQAAHANPGTPGSAVASTEAPPAEAAPDITVLRSEEEKQIQQLQQRLAELKQ